MNDLLSSKDTNAASPKTTGPLHKCRHHCAMRFQQIFHGEWIQFWGQIVCCDGILYFLDFPEWRNHTFTVQNVRHLLQRECVPLDGQR